MKTTAGSRLPALTLPDVGSGAALNLRAGRGPRVLLTTHGGGSAECVRQVERLGEVADRIAEWGGRIVVVAPGGVGGRSHEEGAALVEAAPELVRVVTDPEQRIASAGDEARLVIADEWGEVYFSSEPGARHPSVTPREVLDWVKFIVIQCPECEGPEGEWRSLPGA